jgi:hypothetical protein
MDWQLAAQVAQVISTVLLAIGILASLWIGIYTLREVRSDRIHAIRPKVIFDRGGEILKCEFNADQGIMGIDPKHSAELLKDKPPNATFCVPKSSWGKLSNHGNGSALNVSVTILARKVRRGGEEFPVDDKKLADFPYSRDFNTMPAIPSNIEPGNSAKLSRIPTPVHVDFERTLTNMECVAEINYENIYGNRYKTLQQLYVSVDRKIAESEITMTLGEEIL